MIKDFMNKKWSNKALLEKVEMQNRLVDSLKEQIAKLDTKAKELEECHLAAEKELLEREKLIEKLQERLSSSDD